MSNIISDKKSIRKIFLDSRQSMMVQEVYEKSSLVSDLFFSFLEAQIKNVKNPENISYLHTFLPITKFNEINTHLIIEKLQADYPWIKIVIPKILPENLTMEHIIYNTKLEFLENNWGIAEPVDGEKVMPEENDLIIVPMLACDIGGNRVGYGKGYYDRFLAKCKPSAIKVGLSYHGPIKKISDANEFDIKLNYCITPDKIYNF